jgi:uncharacterized protein (DUF433 family)
MSTQAPSIIRRPDIGLAVAGTRISLYTIMDYLRDGWSYQDIRAVLGLTSEQLRVALDYIEAHRNEVEAEYDEVIREDEERRHFWEARLQEHLVHHPRTNLSSEKAALYANLAEQRAQTIRELVGDNANALSEAEYS